MNRSKLPFRKNCEGYLLLGDKLIAKDTGHYIEFPGGGVDDSESPEKALEREAFEEAGVILDGKLKEVKVLKFIWDKDWAKTDKQKARYEKFQGEEMHFFTGKVKNLQQAKGDKHEEGWQGQVTMQIDEAIRKIKQYSWTKEMDEYRNFQIKMLKELI